MFQKTCVHHQEDYIVHAALYGMFFMHLCKQSSRLGDVLNTQYQVQNMKKTRRIELNTNLKSAFHWLTLHKKISH